MLTRFKFKRALLQSSCWTGAVPYVGATFAMALLVPATPARAANECGAPSGSPQTVVCTDAGNPYSGGINYHEPDGLLLEVRNGVVVNRTPGTGAYSVQLSSSGTGPLHLKVEQGVELTTSGDQAYNVQVHAGATSTSDVTIDFAGNISYSYNGPVSGGAGAGGIIGRASNTDSAASISITQRAESTIDVEGEEVLGLYAYHAGLGDATITSSGKIQAKGYGAYGINLFASNASSTGNLSAVQTAGATISTSGEAGAGVYILHYGLGAIDADIRGSIETDGNFTDGLTAYIANADSAAGMTIRFAETAQVTTQGTGFGAWLLHLGRGATTVTNAGTIETFGASAFGIFAQSSNAANDAIHSVTLTGNGSVTTHGDDASGIRISHAGSGKAEVYLKDASQVTTSGDRAHGVWAKATDNGASTVVQEAGSAISVAGEESYGVFAEAKGATVVGIAGTVQATGASGVGIFATSSDDAATVALGSGAVVTGGWQNDAGGPATPAAGVLIGAATAGLVDTAGKIGAASDRAIADANRGSGSGGALEIRNAGTITGFVEYAEVAGNSFNNTSSGVLELRHFADTDGDGARDTKRVAISDFGGPDSVFNNEGTVRLVPVTGETTTDATGYYAPTTGADSRQLEPTFYDMNRTGIVQAQLVNLGTFNHAGVIDLRGNAIGNTLVITGGAGDPAVFVSNGGKLYVNAVLNEGLAPGGASNSHADMLIVDSTRLGSAPTAIEVGYDPALLGALTTGNGIQLVEVRNKAASAAGVFVLENRIVAGAYEYELFHNGLEGDAADGNWYLRNTLVETLEPGTDPVPPGDPDKGGTPQPDPEPQPEYPNYRPEIPTYVALPALAHRFGMEMLGNYHDRVGQDYIHLPVANPALADTSAQQNTLRRETSMWGRIFGFRGDFGNNNGSVATQYDKFQKRGASYNRHSQGLQLGFDLHRVTGPKGSRLAAGLYAGVGEITGTVDAVYGGRSGKAKLTGYSFGGYWTHTGSKGSYVDFVLQGTRYKSTVETATADGFSPDGWGISVSIEGGTPFVVGDGWVLEPQAQIIHQYVTFENGQDRVARIHYDSSRSTYGRLGARLVRSWTASGDRRMTAWGRFNVWHDFEQKAVTRISTLSDLYPVNLGTSLGGTWGQAQLAISGELTPTVSAFASGDYNFSLDRANAEGFGWRVGMRVRF